MKTLFYFLFLASISTICFAKAYSGSFYDYGGIHLFTSKDQSELKTIEFYKNNSPDDWAMCTSTLTKRLKVTEVKYAWKKEISEFTVNDPKWGEESYQIDLTEIPEAHKWLLSTLVQKGRIIKIISRACGSNLTPYLIKIEK